MSLEWFDRVCGELQDYLESICEKYDEIGHISINRASKHPKVDFFVETEDEEREVFCTLYFDPYNEEFYMEEFDLVLEQTSRTLLPDMEDIIDAVHETFHDFMNDVNEEDDYILIEDEDGDEDYILIEEDDEEVYALEETDDEYGEQEIHVEWTTPEVTAFEIEGEAEIAYQFGIVQETGDGVLRRVNRMITDRNVMMEEETNFFFNREEAGTIVDLIEDNMELMDELHHH